MISKKLIHTLLILTLITQGTYTLAMFRTLIPRALRNITRITRQTKHEQLRRQYCTNTKSPASFSDLLNAERIKSLQTEVNSLQSISKLTNQTHKLTNKIRRLKKIVYTLMVTTLASFTTLASLGYIIFDEELSKKFQTMLNESSATPNDE